MPAYLFSRLSQSLLTLLLITLLVAFGATGICLNWPRACPMKCATITAGPMASTGRCRRSI